MPKTLGLDIVIGASIGSALKSIDLVTNSTKVLGSTIEKLNSKKLSILENLDKEFKEKIEPIENRLQSFYSRQKEIKLKIKAKDEELKEFAKKIKDTQKEIKKLQREKVDLEKDFKKGKISAQEFEEKTKEVEKELLKLEKKKIGLDNKLQLASKKSTILKNSLNSVIKTIGNLKNQKIKLSSELEEAKKKAKETNKELIKIGDAIEEISKRDIKIKANIEKRDKLKSKIFDTIAIATTITIPFKAGIGFEKEMARVKALSNATEEEFRKLQKSAKELGRTTVFSASEAAKGMQFLAMAGFKTNQIIKAMPGLLDLAAAGQIDLAETADITSNILSGFGIKADKTSHVADVLAKAMTTANVDVKMLGETMKYIAPAAASLGASLEEVTTLAAKLGDVGIQGSEAGTALRSMYLRMASPPSEAAKVIEQLGIKTKDANGNFVGMINIIKQLQEKTKGLSNTKIADIMKKLFGTEALSAATALLKLPIKTLKEYEEALKNADGTAKKIAKTQTDTVSGSLKTLGSAIEGLSISFSALFLPVIKTATKGITYFTQKINAFVEEHKTLSAIIGGAAAGFGVLAVSSFVLGYAGTFLANSFHKGIAAFTLFKNATLLLTNAQKKAAFQTKLLSFWSGALEKKIKSTTFFKKAWAAATLFLSKSLNILGSSLKFAGSSITWLARALLTNPIGIAVASIAAAAFLIYKNYSYISSFFKGVFKGIKEEFNSFFKPFKSIFSELKSAAAPLLNTLSPLGKVFNFIGKAIGFVIDKIASFFAPAKATKEELSSIEKTGESVGRTIGKVFKAIFTVITFPFIAGVKVATFALKTILHPIETIKKGFNLLSGYTDKFWNNIKNLSFFINNILLKPVESISAIWSRLSNWFDNFWAHIKNIFKSGVIAITNMFLHPINTIQNLWNRLIGWISKKIAWVSNITSKIKDFFGSFFEEKKETKKLSIKPIVEKVKPIVAAAAITTTINTANAAPKAVEPIEIKPLNKTPGITKPIEIKPLKAVPNVANPTTAPQIVAKEESAKNAQTTAPKTIVYNFNFGDIKVETKDGKIANPENLKEQLKAIIEEINFEKHQRSLSDVV